MPSITRREFLQLLAIAAAAGVSGKSSESAAAERLYDLGKPVGNVTLMHFTDCHAQLLPVHYREPDVNIGLGDFKGKPPHLVGEAFLRHFNIDRASAAAHAYTYLDFPQAART